MSTNEQSAVRAQREHYELVDGGPMSDVGTVAAGTNVLVLGPPMVGKDNLVTDIVGHGTANGEQGIIVSPSTPAQSLREDIPDLASAYLVDCSGVGSGEGFDAEQRFARTASPEDITGIGMSIVKCTKAIGAEATGGLRLGVLSLSTMLQYTDTDRVFNFLHVVTGRVSAAGYLGVFSLDPTIHDDTVVNTIMAQFDGAIKIHQTDDGVQFETVGL